MHILPPSIFVMLVLMTLVTTFMTIPLVSFIKFCFQAREKIKEYKTVDVADGTYKVLLSFGRAANGQIMLDVAYQMFAHKRHQVDLTALHLTVGSDVNPLHTDNFEEVSFGPILYGAKKLGINIDTRYEVSNNAGVDICSIVNNEGYDFLLVGSGISSEQHTGRYSGKPLPGLVLQPLFQTLQGSGILVLSGCLIERQDEDVYRAKQLPGRCIREPEFRQGIERDRGHRLRGGFIPVGIRPDLIEVYTRLGQRT